MHVISLHEVSSRSAAVLELRKLSFPKPAVRSTAVHLPRHSYQSAAVESSNGCIMSLCVCVCVSVVTSRFGSDISKEEQAALAAWLVRASVESCAGSLRCCSLALHLHFVDSTSWARTAPAAQRPLMIRLPLS